jgi:photosystem II stability/assembly factor-like uncharacterized protein
MVNERCPVMTASIRLVGCVAVLMLAGCSSHPATTPTTQAISPSAGVSPTPSASPMPTPSPSLSSAGLTPTVLHPESVTFVSPADGWVLGLSACGTSACLRLAKTVDSGSSWTWVAGAVLPPVAPGSQWELRFADSNDGWISGSSLYATHDGGQTWAKITLPGVGAGASVGALETADGRVSAEVDETIDSNPSGPAALFGSPTNVNAWQPVSGVTTAGPGDTGNISLAQGVFWATLHPDVATATGNESSSTLYSSGNGVAWRRMTQPCPVGSVASVAAATSARIFVVCAGGGGAGSQTKTAYVSENDGASYKQVSDAPSGGDFESAAASPTNVSVASASGATAINSSFNGGVSWTTTYLSGDGGLGLSDLGFTTSTQGVAIHGQVQYPQSMQLLMTRDGGHVWAPVAVIPN